MRKLVKSEDKQLFGVLGGVADAFELDHTLVRLVWCLTTLFSAFPGVLLYIILAIVMPDE